MKKLLALSLVSVVSACALPMRAGQDATGMSFFITSAGPGDGANLGGLAGADRHCQTLAAAVGMGART